MENKTEDRRTRQRKKALHEAMLSLLDEKNLSEISVVELTQRADMNRKTFYNHYPDLNAVIEEIEDDWVDEMYRILARQFQEAGAVPTNEIRDLSIRAGAIATTYFETLITEFEQNRRFINKLVLCGGYSNLQKKLVGKNREILHRLLGIRQDSAWEEFYLTFIVNGTVAVIDRWNRENSPVSVKELAGFFSMLFTADHIYQFLEQMASDGAVHSKADKDETDIIVP